MDSVQIEIQDSANSILGVLDVGNVKNFPLALTTSIADLRDIKKRSGSFSVSFKVPSTKENDNVLEHIYLSEQKNYKDFDAEKDCVIRVNGLDIERGRLQITKINSLGRADATSYSFKFFGNNMDWVLKMKDYKTKDLPYLDKTLVYGDTEVQASWSEVGGNEEPVYSIINRGERIDPDTVNVQDLRADYFALDYLNSAFDLVGYNFESDFFNTVEQKQLMIPLFGKNWKIEQSVIDNAFVDVTLTGSFIGNVDLNVPNIANNQVFVIDTLLTDECTAVAITPPNTYYTQSATSTVGTYTETSDAGNNFSGGVFTAPVDGYYVLDAYFEYSYYYNIFSNNYQRMVTHYIIINGSTFYLIPIINSGIYPTPAGETREQIQATSNAIFLNAGDTMAVKSKYGISNTGPIGGNSTIKAELRHHGGTKFNITLQPTMEEGDSFNWAEKSDDKIDAFDIVMDVFKTFNCYVRTNQGTRTVYAEPRDDFYNPLSSAVNKTDLIDSNRQITLEYNSKTYKENHVFDYSNDSNDAYLNDRNKNSEFNWLSYEHTNPDKFKDGTTNYKLKVIAATYTLEDNYMIMGANPTVTGGGIIAGLYTARLWNDADNFPSASDDFAPRLLYFKYRFQKDSILQRQHLLNYRGDALADIPYALPFSISPFNPTPAYALVDGNLSFSDVFIPNTPLNPNEGLWQEYFSKTSQEIVEGKRLNLNMLFDLGDWVSFNFRDIIYFDNRYPEIEGYWRVEKIKGYKPTSNAISTSFDLVQARTFPKAASKGILNPLDSNSGRYGFRLGGGGKDRTETKQSVIETTIIGQDNYAKDNNNFVVGNGLRSSGQDQTILGRYNVDISTDTFQLGGGISDASRKNLIRVDELGNVFILDNPISDVSDHHSGFYLIGVNEEITIKENKQMVNFNGLEILGTLNINGDLILR